VSGNSFSAGSAASGSVVIGVGNAAALDTVDVNATAVGGPAVTFTFVVGAPANSLEVEIGGDPDASATNLAAQIVNPLNGLDSYVSAALGATGEALVTSLQAGLIGNGITLQATGATLTPVAATALTGGVEGPASAALVTSGANTSVPPLVYTNGIGERTLYKQRLFKTGAPKLTLE